MRRARSFDFWVVFIPFDLVQVASISSAHFLIPARDEGVFQPCGHIHQMGSGMWESLIYHMALCKAKTLCGQRELQHMVSWGAWNLFTDSGLRYNINNCWEYSTLPTRSSDIKCYQKPHDLLGNQTQNSKHTQNLSTTNLLLISQIFSLVHTWRLKKTHYNL